ncbi:hypothetical protein L1049_005399 [Liquidambar formosana]|uniref:ENT domain-containing protein n=1 Tax=Liquidambar formosana TaxID=63359 RepID=A0AAP0RVM2_LIQFO
MKFKQGSSVEVLRRDDDPYGSWFSGEIISADGDNCIVRFKLLMDHDGKPVVENVPGEDVRPRPPNDKGKRWMVGDIAEVFDIHSWRVGKVAEVLKNNHFVIRLFGSIQVKEFHESNVRTRQIWHGNKWSIIGKVGRNKQIANNLAQNNSELTPNLACGALQQVIRDETCVKEKNGLEHHEKDGRDHFKMVSPVRTIKRNHAYCSEPSPEDLLIGGSCKKRKSSLNAGGCDKPLISTLPFFEQVDDISPLKARVSEKSMNKYTRMDIKTEKTTNCSLHSPSRPLWSTEDSNQCSIASCSFNEFAGYPAQNFKKSLGKISDSSDAESTFPSLSVEKHLPPFPKYKLEVDIHKLELRAYKSTVEALYASGPLSWEQESLLTNLRLSLHISNEEHLLQLRHLLSTQVL